MCADVEVRIAHSSSASVDKKTIYVCWRLVTPKIIESILWLDDYIYGYGSFEIVFVLSNRMCLELRLALGTNDRLAIEFDNPAYITSR